jgi:pimeloyl-ACP methyl ester carboxylesterase
LVVLVHGFSVPSYLWQPTFDFLVGRGYQVLRFDLYGRGLSDRPDIDYSIDDYVTQIDALLNQLGVASPFHIIGVSMGGAIVTRFVTRFPERVRRVALIDPLVVVPQKPGMSLLGWPVVGDFIMKVAVIPKIRRGAGDTVFDPLSFPDWELKFEPQTRYKGYAEALRRTSVQLQKSNFLEDYARMGKMAKPVLVVWGEQDRVTPLADSQLLTSRVPQATLHVIERAGHLPHYEHPQQVNGLLEQFLGQLY